MLTLPALGLAALAAFFVAAFREAEGPAAAALMAAGITVLLLASAGPTLTLNVALLAFAMRGALSLLSPSPR